ncbi:K02A2.6-like, partial [Cordylochernes scorpioides]
MNAKIDCKQETIKYDLTNNHDESNFEMFKIKSAKDSIVPECSIKLIKALVKTEDGEYIIEESSKMFQTNGLRLARSLINVINRETHIWITNPYPRPLKIMKKQTLAFGSSPAKINVNREREVEENEKPRFQINENLSPREQKELKQVLERYEDLFSSRLGRTNLAKHRIDTEDAKPIKHKPYMVSPKERDIIKEQIDEMLTEGIIRPSSSPWSFPVILVKKRDGKYRFCVDYRKLNNVTVKDVYPIPRIDEVMDTLQGSIYFSAIDLRSGYWQVEVEERDKEKTAFTTAHGLYEFNVLPFGLCNAPATFERNMENMLGNLRWQICLCYLDDVIIYSPDFPTHLRRLEAVFKCFRESNLRLNDKKCRFAFEELEIIGYITSKHEKPNPEGRAWLLVIPEKKKREIMKEYHNHMSNGHLGVARTMYRIKNKYFWPSMLKDVSEFVKTCHLCQSRKGSNQLPSGLLQPIPPANFPFERIGIDFVGPLPSTKNRKKWIIVLMDYYTRYAETSAVSEATVKEVSKFLVEDIFLRHGAPQYLISDRGSQFTSNLMKEVMKMCKIKHCFTTSYHPQTNGLTGRLNRTLINMLSMYVNTDQKNWDEILPFFTHAYNTTIQETTGYSPFFLMFGREPTSLLDDRNISVDIDKDDYDEYIKHHLDKINRTRKLVINNTIKTQERMKGNYDKKHMERSYEPGELVAVWTPIRKIGKCEKLLRKYFGPYRILKKLSNVNYLIEPKDNPGQDPLIVHVSRIKPYFERIDEVNHADEESISDYLVEIKRLASSCNFGNFLEDSLCDKIVCGLYNAKIQNRILSEGDISLAKVIEIALSMEAAEKNTKLFHLEQGEDCVDKLRMERKVESNFQNGKCKHCGKLHKEPCRFKEEICFKCNKKGHIASICWSSRRNLRQHQNQPGNIHQIGDQEEEEEYVQKIISVTIPEYKINFASSDPPYLMELKVEGNFIKFEMDTGSGLTLISEKDFKNSLQHLKLEKASIIVRTYDGTVVPILGKINVKVECQDITYKLRALVVKGEKRALMGREWINRLKLGCFAVKHMPVEITIEKILKENQALFAETTEPIKGFTFSVNMCDVNPIFHKARPVPFAIRPAVTEALDKMVAKGYLCEVASSKWATPVVVVCRRKIKRSEFAATSRVLSGIGGVICYIDDVLIATASIEEHLALLKTIFARLAKYNIKLKKEKCLFLQKEIEYLGNLVTGKGIRPLDHKVQAIQKAKTLTNISELRSFLGLINFYGKFIPNLPELLKPLHELLHKKRPWVWTKECGEAIDKCKYSITSERVLVPYDTTLPLCLATDASQIGVGAVLSHIIEGQERPIMFASRTLSEAEQNYSQIEKEALAIIYGVTKFHQFIYGRKFILITDHKPLVTILGSRSGIPTLSTSRLQRWALILSAYTYDIKFRRTQDHGNADLLSRFPVGCEEIPRLNNVYALSYVEELPITAEEIATETEKDEVLSLAKFYTQQGWPEKVADHLRPYFQRKLELTVDGECLVWGMRVVIPPSLRIKMLNCLHETHSGMNKMKAVARSHFWWPNLDTQIEFLVNKCRSCQESQDGPNEGKWQPWRWSTRPWQRIHIDFANKENINLLIVVDSHSKWIEAIPMRETTTRKTIEQLRRLFSSYGLPEELVSDNGPQFTGSEMKGFLEGNGIKQTLIPAYHPQSNGLAERAVKAYHRDQIRKRWRNGEEDESGDGERQPEHSRGAGPSAIISEVVRDRGYMESLSPGLTSQRSDQDSEVQSDTDDGKSLEPLLSLDPEALKEEGLVLRRNPPRARRPPEYSGNKFGDECQQPETQMWLTSLDFSISLVGQISLEQPKSILVIFDPLGLARPSKNPH